jgi:hypothetical protein
MCVAREVGLDIFFGDFTKCCSDLSRECVHGIKGSLVLAYELRQNPEVVLIQGKD